MDMTKQKPTVAKMIAFCDESPYDMESRQYVVMQPRPGGQKGLWTVNVTHDMPTTEVVDMFMREHLYSRNSARFKAGIMPYVRVETETQHIRVFGYSRIFKWPDFKDLSKNDLILLEDVVNDKVHWNSECRIAFEAAMHSPAMKLIIDHAELVKESRAHTRFYSDAGAGAPLR